MINFARRRGKYSHHSIFALSTGVVLGFVGAYGILISLFNWESLSHCTLLDTEEYKTKNKLAARSSVDTFYFKKDTLIADKLYQKVKVLCFVFTVSDHHDYEAEAVKNTWGQRCNKLVFISDAIDTSLPSVAVNISDSIQPMWDKTLEAFKYVYYNHYHDVDWFLKADDKNFVILENLRYLLSRYDPNDYYYFGVKYKSYDVKQGYMSDKAGYVLSKAALQRLTAAAIPHLNDLLYGMNLGHDFKIGLTLEKIEVKAVDTRDSLGHERFHPFTPGKLLIKMKEKNSSEFEKWQNRFYIDNKSTCCSDTAITFSDLDYYDMYELNYLIYTLKPYGILLY